MEGSLKRLILLMVGFCPLVGATVAFAASNTAATARLVRVTSPARRNSNATLVARVVPAQRCTIAVLYKSGPSQAQGLNPEAPGSRAGLVDVEGRGNTTPW